MPDLDFDFNKLPECLTCGSELISSESLVCTICGGHVCDTTFCRVFHMEECNDYMDDEEWQDNPLNRDDG